MSDVTTALIGVASTAAVGYFAWLALQIVDIKIRVHGIITRLAHMEKGHQDHEDRLRKLEE